MRARSGFSMKAGRPPVMTSEMTKLARYPQMQNQSTLPKGRQSRAALSSAREARKRTKSSCHSGWRDFARIHAQNPPATKVNEDPQKRRWVEKAQGVWSWLRLRKYTDSRSE